MGVTGMGVTGRGLLILAAGLLPTATLAPVPTAAATTIRLGGVRVSLLPGTTQVITVNRTRTWHARVTLWQQNASGWQAVARARDGRIGYGGLVAGARRHQGTGTTPTGTYRLLGAFGTHAPATVWRLPYREIQRGDFWVEDNGSAYYNRYRNQAGGGFRWWLKDGADTSERLTDYPTQYEYAINTGYNFSQVRHRGAGIFLHVNGKAATAGCVSTPHWFMQAAMARLDPAREPVIAVGR
ncbi:MAG: secreted protein [Marmoricola sp.]|nr:secreted protein [Marmoricola sp.]